MSSNETVAIHTTWVSKEHPRLRFFVVDLVMVYKGPQDWQPGVAYRSLMTGFAMGTTYVRTRSEFLADLQPA